MVNFDLSTDVKSIVGGINELKEGASGSGNGVYYLNGFGNINLIDYDNLETVKQNIQTAIGGLDNFIQALQDGKQIIDKVTVGSTPTDIPWNGFRYSIMSEGSEKGVMITADNPLTVNFGDELLRENLVRSITSIAISNNNMYQFMICPAEYVVSTDSTPISTLLKLYIHDYFYIPATKITGDYAAYFYPFVVYPFTINGVVYNVRPEDDGITYTFTSYYNDISKLDQIAHEYIVEATSGSVSYNTYKIRDNILCIESGESAFWRSQTAGTLTGTLQQNQYDLIKKAIDKGCSIIIDIPYSGYTAHFQSVSSSKGSVEGEYTFCYLDYDPTTNNFFIK